MNQRCCRECIFKKRSGAATFGGHQLKRDTQAIADYDEAICFDSQDPEPFRWRGWAWKRKGEDAKALNDLNEAIRLNPLDASSWRIRSAVYSAKKKLRSVAPTTTVRSNLHPSMQMYSIIEPCC